MTEFQVEIRLGETGARSAGEVASLLHQVANRLTPNLGSALAELRPLDGGMIEDARGRVVGEWRVVA